MFKKPLANLKSFSPLRSSDRRRFQNDAYEAYPSVKEICTAATEEGASPTHLMPDDLRSAKFISHTGTAGVVYKSEKQALWISLENLPPIPTVYTMWQYPNMLPKLYTWGPVVRRLMDGADLMIPGLVLGPEGKLPELNTGDLVAITIKGYPMPLAIGTMAVPTSEIRPRSGMKGKAVHIIHVYEDFLWAMGDKSGPPELESISDDEYEEEEVEDEGDGEAQQDETKPSEPEQSNNIHEMTQKMDAASVADTKQLTTNEIDEWLKKSLYHALVFKIKSENASSVLPLSASSFYSAYIMPCRPVDVGSEIDIKKSSWKKLQKFLKAMDKAGLLKTKEQRGETMVMSVNYSHPSLQDLRKYKTMESAATQSANAKDNAAKEAAATAATSAREAAAAKSASNQIEIQEIFKPLGNSMQKLFEEARHDKDGVYTIPQVRQVMMDYIKLHNVVDLQNQKMINIDPTLCDAILAKPEYNSINKLSRDQILHRMCQKMQPFHAVKLPGKEAVLKKGACKPIEIVQEVRQGRKTITKVSGVEGFGLDVEELSKELTRLCASSATYNPIHGVSPKNPLYEIMVQGPQIRTITHLLVSKGVPLRFIDTEDKTAKKGKGKK
ncbi:eukaryotic translation initiation factor SUI1 family protein [Mucor ambiguus]|uniref:Eukaryotic translation initiation factor SUI1 family protein n=1 Tax=Mucor ambiguus TaxID=91626 RepID=A0A0C9MJQ8_9FUNG|nr:eukaryotic translation initiation factor SUI1 family protein [Mucor ambiguus]